MAFIHSVLFCEVVFFVYCGAMVDIGTDLSAHMEMIGFVAKIGTIQKGLDKPPIQS